MRTQTDATIRGHNLRGGREAELTVLALAMIIAFFAINIPSDDLDSIDYLMHPEIMGRFT